MLVDTSALYALLDRADRNHLGAVTAWQRLSAASEEVLTHNYVLLETCALVQRRLGMTALRTLTDDLLPPVTILWVESDLHQRAVASLAASQRRDVSLVDWVSFEVMRRFDVEAALAYDAHFAEFGLSTLS